MGRGLVDNNKIECYFYNCSAGLGFGVVEFQVGRMGVVFGVVVGGEGVPGVRVGNLH